MQIENKKAKTESLFRKWLGLAKTYQKSFYQNIKLLPDNTTFAKQEKETAIEMFAIYEKETAIDRSGFFNVHYHRNTGIVLKTSSSKILENLIADMNIMGHFFQLFLKL